MKHGYSQRGVFIERFTKTGKSAEDVGYIRDCIRDCGALDDTLNRHKDLIDEAYDLLDELVIKEYNRDVLRGVVESVEDIPL